MGFSPATSQAVNESCLRKIKGRTTKPAALKYFDSGKAVASTTIAVNPNGRDGPAYFFEIEAWGALGEGMANQVKDKGVWLTVEGKVKESQWKKRDGSDGQSVILTAESFSTEDPGGFNPHQVTKEADEMPF